MLNGVVEPLFDIYSTDVDHSGAFGAADVLRVIDLLNGAIPYIVWLGVEKPEFPVGDPGCFDGGDCCIGNGTPGCDNSDCCELNL